MTPIRAWYPNRSRRNQPSAFQEIGQSIVYWTTRAQNLFDAADGTYKDALEGRKTGKPNYPNGNQNTPLSSVNNRSMKARLITG
jgi:hypothetical protein